MIEGVYTFQRERDMLGAPVLADFISETDAVDLGRALTEPNFSFFLERPGPRNVLLWNRGGGRFERAPSGHPLSQLVKHLSGELGDLIWMAMPMSTWPTILLPTHC